MNTCEWCKEPKAKKRFCNRSCSNAWQHANGVRRVYVNDKTTWEWWVERYGEEEALKRKELHRQATSTATVGEKNPMHGRHDHVHGLLQSHRARTGKTYDEFYGPEKSQMIRRKLSVSHQGDRNPAYGHVYERGGRSRVQGVYSGIRFRSSYELSWLVETLSAGAQVSVPQAVKYVLGDRKRTYLPDFQIGYVVYEIKPSALVSHPSNVAKFTAIRSYCDKHGLQFQIVTERDINLLTFGQIAALEGVNWNEGSRKYVEDKLQDHRD